MDALLGDILCPTCRTVIGLIGHRHSLRYLLNLLMVISDMLPVLFDIVATGAKGKTRFKFW